MKKLITEQEFTKEVSRLQKLAGIEQVGPYQERKRIKNMYNSYLVESNVFTPLKPKFDEKIGLAQMSFFRGVTKNKAFLPEERAAISLYRKHYGHIITEEKAQDFLSNRTLLEEGFDHVERFMLLTEEQELDEKNVLQRAKDWVVDKAKAVGNWFSKAWDKIKNVFGNIKAFLVKIWNDLKAWAVKQAMKVKEKALGMYNKIKEKIKAFLEGAKAKSGEGEKTVSEEDDKQNFPFRDFVNEVSSWHKSNTHIKNFITAVPDSVTAMVGTTGVEKGEELMKKDEEPKGAQKKVAEHYKREVLRFSFTPAFTNLLMLEESEFKSILGKKKFSFSEGKNAYRVTLKEEEGGEEGGEGGEETKELPTDITKEHTHSVWAKLGHVLHWVGMILMAVLSPVNFIISKLIALGWSKIIKLICKIAEWLKGPKALENYAAIGMLIGAIAEFSGAVERISEAISFLGQSVSSLIPGIGPALAPLQITVEMVGHCVHGLALYEIFHAIGFGAA